MERCFDFLKIEFMESKGCNQPLMEHIYTRTINSAGASERFEVTVDVHQGSPLNAVDTTTEW